MVESGESVAAFIHRFEVKSNGWKRIRGRASLMKKYGRFWMVEEQLENTEFVNFMDNDGWYQDQLRPDQYRKGL